MKLAKRIGTIAVVLDEAAGKTEMVDVDRIAIVSLVINGVTGVAQFALVFGGLDSLGRFHIDLARADEAALITVTRAGMSTEFDAIFLDANGNIRMDYPREWFLTLCGMLLPVAHKQIWGVKYPTMEVTSDGQVLFSAGNAL